MKQTLTAVTAVTITTTMAATLHRIATPKQHRQHLPPILYEEAASGSAAVPLDLVVPGPPECAGDPV